MKNFDFFAEQQDIFKHFGQEAQAGQLIKEFEELFLALKNKDLKNIQEELADVHNVLMQFIDFYGVKEIHKIAVEKIERTKKRIKEGYYEKNQEE